MGGPSLFSRLEAPGTDDVNAVISAQKTLQLADHVNLLPLDLRPYHVCTKSHDYQSKSGSEGRSLRIMTFHDRSSWKPMRVGWG